MVFFGFGFFLVFWFWLFFDLFFPPHLGQILGRRGCGGENFMGSQAKPILPSAASASFRTAPFYPKDVAS